jgi:hypothetical protein
MTWHVRDGGTWKEVTDPSARDGGTWKPVQEAYVRDGGTWKLFFELAGINITNRTVYASRALGNTATAQYDCRRNGTANYSVNGGGSTTISGEWHTAPTATIGDGYETRLVSGTLTGWPASWTALSATRSCSFSSSALGTYETSGVIAIRKIGDTGDGVTATITLRCNIYDPV